MIYLLTRSRAFIMMFSLIDINSSLNTSENPSFIVAGDKVNDADVD